MRGFAKLWLYFRMTLLNVLVLVAILTTAQPVPTPIVLANHYPNINQKVIKSGFPTRLVIPSLDLDLEVGRGSYNISDRTWTIDDKHAFYADLSIPLNDNNGTTLIYGHGQAQVFGGLPNIKPGAIAIVYSDSDYLFSYKYESVKNVVPSDLSVFTAEGEPNLVLQTCTGPLDSYRGLFKFKLEEVKKV